MSVDVTDLKGTLEALLIASRTSAEKRADIFIESSPDALDQTQFAAQRDLAATLLNRETKMYRRVQRALQRIEDGSYGICLACDEPISAKRLQAVPWAEYCLVCQGALDAQRQGLLGHSRTDGLNGLAVEHLQVD